MKIVSGLLLGSVLMTMAGAASAADPAEGRWQAFDDKQAGTPTSIINVTVRDGKLVGTIEQVNKPGVDPNGTCTACKDANKDKPLKGLTIMWGLAKDGDEWSGGRILDPDNGEIYKCKVKANGDSLDVRGFIGISLIGRTQTWKRVK